MGLPPPTLLVHSALVGNFPSTITASLARTGKTVLWVLVALCGTLFPVPPMSSAEIVSSDISQIPTARKSARLGETVPLVTGHPQMTTEIGTAFARRAPPVSTPSVDMSRSASRVTTMDPRNIRVL
jgi:hypothetical protein